MNPSQNFEKYTKSVGTESAISLFGYDKMRN